MMRFAYADPPYIGQSKRLYGHHRDFAGEVDHAALIARLVGEYPDGWALSCSSPSLRQLLPLCPETVRVLSWVKSYTPARPGVPLVYAWEPVLLCGGRRRNGARGLPYAFDWVCTSTVSVPTQKRTVGIAGAKPEAFCFWVFDALGAQAGDALEDVFPGSGAVTRAWHRWQQRMALLSEGEQNRQPVLLES